MRDIIAIAMTYASLALFLMAPVAGALMIVSAIVQALSPLRFAAAAAKASAPPIRPMSVSGRADLGSSGGSESCVLGRAELSEHGQPRQPDAHGPDAGGNPAKLGAPIDRVEGPGIEHGRAS